MNLFKILVTIFFSVHILYAYDYTNLELEEELSNWNYFGEFKTYLAQVDKNVNKVKDNGEVITRNRRSLSFNALQLSVDYFNDGLYFSATPYAYIYLEKDNELMTNTNFPEPFDRHGLFFRTIYTSYTFDKLTIGAGVLPLSNSFPMQYTNDYFQDGEGLSTISDVDPLALFTKYQFSDTNRVVLGVGLMDTHPIPGGKYVAEHYKEDSYGGFITHTLEMDKYKIINDFKYINGKYNGVDLGELYNYGIGLSWDDSEYSGWILYNVFGLSLYENHSITAKETILNSNPKYPKAYNGAYRSSFVFNDDRYYGASNLIGIRKDIELFNLDSFINFEWFHTFNDWESSNQGTPYNSNCNQISNIRDDSFFFNYGIRLSQLSTLKFNYTYLEFDKQINIGAPSSTSIEKSYGVKRDKARIYKVSFSYKF